MILKTLPPDMIENQIKEKLSHITKLEFRDSLSNTA